MDPQDCHADEVASWFTERVPGDWFADGPECALDRDEILVTGRLADGTDPEEFRERTRDERIAVASRAERTFARKVSWAVRVADAEHRFTTVSVPVMTRLRLEERVVLDTLIAGGVARSRSEALAWCVRLVADHEADWIRDLQQAAARIDEVRRRGPGGA